MSLQHGTISITGVSVTLNDGVGITGQDVGDLSESVDRRVVRFPRWPVSEAQTGLGIRNSFPFVFPHEISIESNAAVAELPESVDRRVVRLPCWPVSEAQAGLDTGTSFPYTFPHEMIIAANAAVAELLVSNSHPLETFAQLTIPEWFISMHVHGVNDYGMSIIDFDYEDRSDVTTFLSEITTTASLDDPAHCITYIDDDSSEAMPNLMNCVPYHQVESES